MRIIGKASETHRDRAVSMCLRNWDTGSDVMMSFLEPNKCKINNNNINLNIVGLYAYTVIESITVRKT